MAPSTVMHGVAPILVEEEVTLADTVATLWLYRWFVIAPAVLAAVAIYAYSVVASPVYEAVAKVEVKYPVGQPPSPAVLASFRTSLGSSIIAERVLKLPEVTTNPSQAVPQFLASNVVVEGVRNTNLLLVRGRAREAARAAAIANGVVDQTIAWHQEQIAITNPPPTVDPVGQAEAQLREAMESLESFRIRQPVEVWRTDLQTNLGIHTERRRLDMDVEASRTRVARLREELDRAASDSASQASVSRLQDLLAAAQIDLATTERRQRLLAENFPQAASGLSRLTRAELELALRTDLYNIAKARYLEALATQRRPVPAVPTLAVLDRAVQPPSPISPRPLRNAAIAGVVVLTIVSLVALLIDAVRVRLVRRQLPMPRARAS